MGFGPRGFGRVGVYRAEPGVRSDVASGEIMQTFEMTFEIGAVGLSPTRLFRTTCLPEREPSYTAQTLVVVRAYSVWAA